MSPCVNDSLHTILFAAMPGVAARYASQGVLRREIAAFEASGAGGGGRDWLSGRERRQLNRLRDPSRREDWRFGRGMLKRLVTDSQSESGRAEHGAASAGSLDQVEILPQTHGGLSDRPLMMIQGAACSARISISHGAGGVLVAMGLDRTLAVGVDLIATGGANDGFLQLWFTEDERRWLAQRPELALLAWGVKEASYKALQRGEAFVPAAYEVDFDGDTRLGHRTGQHGGEATPLSPVSPAAHRVAGERDRARGGFVTEPRWRCRQRRSGVAVDVEIQELAGRAWAILAHRPERNSTEFFLQSESSRCGVHP